MKKILFLALISLFGCKSLSAQRKVDNYLQMIHTRPQILGSSYDIEKGSIQKKQLRVNWKHKADEDSKKLACLLDEDQVIDYLSDTIYVLNDFYFPAGVSSVEAIKTKKGAFAVMGSNNDDGYRLLPIKEYLERYEEKDWHSSEELFYKTFFSWDISAIVQLIESSGVRYDGAEGCKSLSRFVLKDNKVVYRDHIVFPSAVRWYF